MLNFLLASSMDRAVLWDATRYLVWFCRRFFDPKHWKIVLVDQRGCGASRPLAHLPNNNMQALIDDYELLRKHLKIRKWLLFGGSWGVTLSLAYAQQQPNM